MSAHQQKVSLLANYTANVAGLKDYDIFICVPGVPGGYHYGTTAPTADKARECQNHLMLTVPDIRVRVLSKPKQRR